MKKFKLKIESEALSDIQEITDWYNEQQEGTGKKFQETVVNQLNSLNKDLHNKITEIRKQKGWSQSELAKQISVSREIVGRYERGDAVPSIDIAKRMADAFELSVDYLVGPAEKQINKEMLHRIEEVDKMKPEEKKMIYTFLDAFISKTKLQALM